MSWRKISLLVATTATATLLMFTAPALASENSGGGFSGASTCTLPDVNTNPLFGFPHWWQYLQGEPNPTGGCEPTIDFPSGIWLIGLAVLNMLLHVAGIVAVVSIIVAGVMYLTSNGNPDRAGAALQRIIYSLVGLAIVLVAAAVVTFVGNRLGG